MARKRRHPRSFERGDEDYALVMDDLERASMGPRSFERGDTGNGTASRGGGAVLQWGRVLSNAEIHAQAYQRARNQRASMGPRSFERGDRRLQRIIHDENGSFNGAAFFRTRRSRREVIRWRGAQCFNGAAFFRTRRCRRSIVR